MLSTYGSPYVPKNILLLVGTPTIKRGGKIVIPVHSVAGLVRAVATLAGARTVYGRNWRTTTGGTVKLVIAPNRHAKALLARRKKLNLQVTVRLLPASGAATQTAVLKTIVKARLRRR